MRAVRPGRRVGVFGGTFDPPHNAHLVGALAARRQLGLEQVLMVVAGDPWQKRERVEADAHARLEMVQLLCDGVDGLVASDVEVARGGATYTIDTVTALRADDPGLELVLLLGADAVAMLDTWHRADELAALIEVAALPRWSERGERLASAPPSARWRVTELDMPRLDIESTALRTACRRRDPIDGLTTPAVVRYIREHRLYTRV